MRNRSEKMMELCILTSKIKRGIRVDVTLSIKGPNGLYADDMCVLSAIAHVSIDASLKR